MHDLSTEYVKNDLDLIFKVTEVKLRSIWAQFGVYSPIKIIGICPLSQKLCIFYEPL